MHRPDPKASPVTESIRPFVDDNQIAGAVVLIARHGEIVEFDSIGHADLETNWPMTKDALFWVASMTKPIISAAILVLSDAGKLSVDDPVEKFLPEFKDLWVIAEKSEGRVVLEKNTVSPTLRHLLAHTDGFSDVPPPVAETPLAEWVRSVSRMPLHFTPGTKWLYNNSGLNALGRIVEIVSGQSLEEFLQIHFFRPLGMTDTTFFPSAVQLQRLATSYRYEADEKKLTPISIFLFQGPLNSPRLTVCPGGGLFSTATDMFRFYQMLLDGGVGKGGRFLSEEAFRELTTCQTGDLETGFTSGMCFGLGVGMVKNPTGVTAEDSPGTFGHGGVYGTQAWVDPKKRVTSILMCQISNLTPNPAGSTLREVFNKATAKFIAQLADKGN